MKDSLAKVLPMLVGLAIGWLIFHPPAFLEPLGPLRYLAMAALGFALLVAFVAYLIAAGQPKRLELTPLEGPFPAELRVLVDRLERLGFRPADPPRMVNLSPPAVMAALVHASEPVYATVFRTGTVPAAVSFDFVSLLAGDRGGLTTMPTWRGGTLPAAPGNLRQIFESQAPEPLWENHLRAVAFLRSRGLPCRAVSATGFADDFARSLARQQRHFSRSPLRCALVSLYRSAFRRVPHTGPLESQPGIEEQIRELQSGVLDYG